MKPDGSEKILREQQYLKSERTALETPRPLRQLFEALSSWAKGLSGWMERCRLAAANSLRGYRWASVTVSYKYLAVEKSPPWNKPTDARVLPHNPRNGNG